MCVVVPLAGATHMAGGQCRESGVGRGVETNGGHCCNQRIIKRLFACGRGIRDENRTSNHTNLCLVLALWLAQQVAFATSLSFTFLLRKIVKHQGAWVA